MVCGLLGCGHWPRGRLDAVSAEFLLTAFIIVATPGTGVLYTLAAGLSRGARASVVAAVGCTLGILPPMIAAMTGLAALLHTSALAFQTLKYFGVAYLLYLAWATFKDKGTLAVEERAAPRSAWSVVIVGVLITLLNPKLTIFFFAFLPQFSEGRFHARHADRVRRLRAVAWPASPFETCPMRCATSLLGGRREPDARYSNTYGSNSSSWPIALRLWNG